MLYRGGRGEDISRIVHLAKQEAGQTLTAERVTDSLKRYPNKIAEDQQGISGFALSEEVCRDVLLVHALAVRRDHRCDEVGRNLLELLESRAADIGYHGIMVSGFVQNALLGCEDDMLTFAGYSDIYNTGGSRLLVKSVN